LEAEDGELTTDKDGPDLGLGAALFGLHVDMERWINRRVEHVLFLDDRSYRRSISVDVSTQWQSRSAWLRSPRLLPISLLRKHALIGFDLRDEQGASLPMLTREQNASAAWSMLCALAHFIARERGEKLREEVVEDIRVLTGCFSKKASESLERLWSARIGSRIRTTLYEDETFRGLAEDLSSNFLLLVEVPDLKTNRRVFKYSYIERFEWPEFHLPKRLGWQSTYFEIEVPAVGQSQSYHFEVEAPAGLTIESAELRSGETVLTRSTRTGPSCHLYFPPEEPYPIETPRAVVGMHPGLADLVRTSTMFAVLVMLLLGLFAWQLAEVKDASALSLLLTLPGLVALFIVRPREHGMTTRLLLAIRLSVTLVGFLPFLAALALAIDVSFEVQRVMWTSMTAVAAAAAGALGATAISASARSFDPPSTS
jgi:hypothetical protein